MDLCEFIPEGPTVRRTVTPIRLVDKARKAICDGCFERPEGCWKAVQYGCEKARKEGFRNAKTCPIGLWDGPKTYHLPNIKTFVYTTAHQTARHERVRRFMDHAGFTDWQFFYGTNPSEELDGWGRGKDYWRYIPRDHARLLREHDAPLLILEDDIEPRDYQPDVTVPIGAEMVYLGGGRGGDRRGTEAARRNIKDEEIYRNHRHSFQIIDDDWMRIFGMWFTHAVLHINKAVMLEVADHLMKSRPIDTTLAIEQWRWNVVCRRVPMWWQNDGKHRSDTFDYNPRLEHVAVVERPPATTAEKRRSERHGTIAKRRR